MNPVVIIGGGISGLATAYYLRQDGIPSVLIESEARLGGVIATETIEGCTVELGAEAFLTAKTAGRDLCVELGLGDELIGSDESKRGTFIWRDGRLVRLPEGLTMMVPGKLGALFQSPLLSWAGKLRAGAEIFRRPSTIAHDRSVSEFVQQHYGTEILDYLAEPLLAGVFGGDATLLSADAVLPKFVQWEKRYGSLTRAARKESRTARNGPLFTTLRSGLGTLIRRLADRARPTVIHARAEKLEQGWRVRAGGDWLSADHVVLACRPDKVLPNLFPQVAYSSAAVIALGFHSSEVTQVLGGSGVLIPRIERGNLMACTWVNNKFADRTPEDIVLIRCFVQNVNADPLPELREKLRIGAKPIFMRKVDWPDSMPQYHVGHLDLVKMTEEMLADFPGLHLVGNAYHGVGIPDCISMAKRVAIKISASVRAQLPV